MSAALGMHSAAAQFSSAEVSAALEWFKDQQVRGKAPGQLHEPVKVSTMRRQLSSYSQCSTEAEMSRQLSAMSQEMSRQLSRQLSAEAGMNRQFSALSQLNGESGMNRQLSSLSHFSQEGPCGFPELDVSSDISSASGSLARCGVPPGLATTLGLSRLSTGASDPEEGDDTSTNSGHSSPPSAQQPPIRPPPGLTPPPGLAPRAALTLEQALGLQPLQADQESPSRQAASSLNVILKKLPPTYTKELLMRELLDTGFSHERDYDHLRLQGRLPGQLSCFIRFKNAAAKQAFITIFHNRRMRHGLPGDGKVAEVVEVTPAAQGDDRHHTVAAPALPTAQQPAARRRPAVAPAAPPPHAPAVPMQKAAFCPNCGFKPPAEANFCVNCGNKVPMVAKHPCA